MEGNQPEDGTIDSIGDSQSTISVEINENINLVDWEKDGRERYLLKHLFKPKKKIDEKISAIDHFATTNDCIEVTSKNILCILQLNHDKRSTGCEFFRATTEQAFSAARWLKAFRKQMIVQMMRYVEGEYFEASNQKQWQDIIPKGGGKGFTSFQNLQQRTKESTSKTVRK